MRRVPPRPSKPIVLPDPAPAGAKPPKIKTDIVVMRVNPFNRTVARMTIQMSTEPADGAAAIARVCRTNRLGSSDLDLELDGLIVTLPLKWAGSADGDRADPGWKLDHHPDGYAIRGIAIIFAAGPNGGMVSLPPSIGMIWAKEHLIWVDGEVQVEDATDLAALKSETDHG